MVNVLATGAALLAVGLFVVALFSMTTGDLRTAGFSFLSASLVIYIRETRLV
ncbi:MAG: hypothetical protein ABEJ05_12710 [Haloglomus sp.]